jgi:FKBP-type peptidyl-prolyl cis-trans isomerase SlpA
MMSSSNEPLRAALGNHLTLHYSLGVANTTDASATIISTFDGRPATLTLGLGQMAEPLEALLVGMAEGERKVFELPAGTAFGERSPELIQRVSLAMLKTHGDPDETYELGDLVQFPGPGGVTMAGVVKAIDQDGAVFDFNHPLAGQPIRFEVYLLGVLQ